MEADQTFRTAHEQVVCALWGSVRAELRAANRELHELTLHDWSEVRASWQAARISELIAILDILDDHWKAYSSKPAPWDQIASYETEGPGFHPDAGN